MSIDRVIVIGSLLTKHEGKTLLVKRSSQSSYEGYWQLPEGKKEENESSEENILREVREELGVNATNLAFKELYVFEILVKGINHLIVRTVFTGGLDSFDIVISDEHTDFGWFTKEEALKLNLIPGTEKTL